MNTYKLVAVSLVAFVLILFIAISLFNRSSTPLPTEVQPVEKPIIPTPASLPENTSQPQSVLPLSGNNTGQIRSEIPAKPVEVVIEKKVIDDAVSTLSSPVKVATLDGKQYFMVGQPKGQNSKSPRKIIFSLPGHGSTAEQDYTAWKSHIVSNGTYALASVNWWDGEGEKTSDYYRPDEVLAQMKGFLDTYGYTEKDFVILEGFSRGSANTYPVKAYDMVSGAPFIDAVISASGKYQADFPLTPNQKQYQGGKLYQDVPWILVCGAKDDNPARDGCVGMSETKAYLESTGAKVLALLEDPNAGHGAFHQSKLGLVKKALTLLDALPQAK